MKIYLAFLILILTTLNSALANPFIFKNEEKNLNLRIEVLKNGFLHFEYSSLDLVGARIWTSPMIIKESLELQTENIKAINNTIETEKFKLTLNDTTFCIKLLDKNQNWNFINLCPKKINEAWKGFSFYSPETKNLYGLGQYFTNAGSADGDLVGRVWDPLSSTHGNALRSFSKGANGYAMFPIIYGMGTGNQNFALFYDNIYKQMWSLNTTPYQVDSYGDQVRFFIFTGTDIVDVRKSYMGLTGHAPVPNKDVFGLWISEFGYDSWDELKGEIQDLREKKFPLDGAALDLQWFGGTFYNGNDDRTGSRFGTLEFDEINFANPKEEIKNFKENIGISLMPIEESYISENLTEHQNLAQQGYMAKWCGSNSPVRLTANPWWGIGGMIDWTNPAAGNYWHDTKRQKLIDMGITHHWTDLGEPEMYEENSCYFGFPELNKNRHADIHNVYNFKWLESIFEGYKRNKVNKRNFMMSRSGTSGIQRFGAAFWSGDIGANMGAMTAHYNAQMHMSFSGVDYYGADIGGFHRSDYTLDGDANELFTQWFANASLFDFPVRSHTWNTNNDRVTSPSKIGETKSNLANIYLRYKLFPYYYSLAHKAYKEGTTIITPMPMAYPENLEVRTMGHQKMIGPFLMAGLVASYGETQRNVYFPKDIWFNYHTGKKITGTDSYQGPFSTRPNGAFQIPLFIKAGAIIPTMFIDNETMNISGKRFDGTTKNDLGLLIVGSTKQTSFTLTEDDGTTLNYQKGEIATTLIEQVKIGNSTIITIHPTIGKKSISKRNLNLEVYAESVSEVLVNGKKIGFKQIKSNLFQLTKLNIDLTVVNKVIIKE